MAERRMISKKIVDTDLFLDMPMSSRYLYYELNWRADDDGFVASPKKITKMVGCSDNDLGMLVMKRFIIPFDSGVCVIKDWRIHNYIQKDRYHETQYLDEKSELEVSDRNSYELIPKNPDTKCIQPVSNPYPEVRLELGKDRVRPPIVPHGDEEPDPKTSFKTRFEAFWKAYPRKSGKGAAEKAFLKYKPDDALLGKMLSAVEAQKDAEQWKRDGGQYIPYPATWLNQKRWEDEAEPENLKSDLYRDPMYKEFEDSGIFDTFER